MFENLQYLFERGLLRAAELDRAVGLGWITEEQKEQIAGGAA